jgi:hypothetical protein
MQFKIGFAIAAVATVSLAPIAASAHNTGYHHTHQRSNGDDQLVGGAIGAVAGAVIGSQLAGNGARTEGSVLGAVIGGVAGAAIADNGNNRHYSQGGGYYNPNTGYYGGYNTHPQTTYRTGTTTHYGNGHYSHGGGYYQPNYRTTYTTTYSRPHYNSYHRPYYGGHVYTRPRTSININLGNTRRHYSNNRGYRNRSHGHNRNYRRRGH